VKYLDLTYADGARNLACDEALLDYFDQAGGGQEVLRFWQSENYFVVLGHGNKWRDEAIESACAMDRIPIMRRCSGGGAILQGPGCLNYSLILRQDRFLDGRVQAAFDFVLSRHCRALQALTAREVSVRGISDLTFGDLKFSGNAQYRKRRYVLVHGTFLLDFNFQLIEKYLRPPAVQPDYRRLRNHADFLVNMALTADQVCAALCSEWDANELFARVPHSDIEDLMCSRYARLDWHEKF
jgi:lipoate-protein ligase A